ncbi:MAG: homocysteine S-methyltransferase family protein, partial [Cryobacterium sp.]|nr:homocysteine S-methyltransferase family protein [Oligoflexia bacterium]
MKPKISITSPLVFDGGVGTELYDRGFYINRPFEELNLLSPRHVIAVHESYIAAGANVLTLNTFSANQPQFKKFDIEENLGPLIAAALQCGNTARRNSGTTRPKSFDIGVVAPNESDTSDCVRLAFSVGPIGELVEPLGSVGLDEARTIYKKTASFALEAA